MLAFVAPYRWLALGALLALTAVVAMDLAIPRLIQRIIDQGIHGHDRSVVVATALAMLGISAASTVLAIVNNMLSVRVGEAVARDLRERLFTKIQGYSLGNLDRQKTGQLLVRLTSDVAAVKSLTQISLRIGTRAPLMMIGSLALMISTSPHLALVLAPLLLVTALLIGFFVTRMEPKFRVVQQRLDRLNNVLQENITGARLVKALVRAEHEGERFEAANEELTARSIEVTRFMASMAPALTMCVNLGVVVVIAFGGVQSIDGTMSTGQIVAFTNYLLTTMTPLVMMTMLSNMWAAGLASLRRMDEVLDSVPDVLDAADATDVPADAPAEVTFDGVRFAYATDGTEAVLAGVTFA
ncbi:MAG TPA: ABC transporter permease, partial [Polyangiaceae bacterium]|nr:ABC transporter permease [Polyangiaceae bacterium]